MKSLKRLASMPNHTLENNWLLLLARAIEKNGSYQKKELEQTGPRQVRSGHGGGSEFLAYFILFERLESFGANFRHKTLATISIVSYFVRLCVTREQFL
jgi:hypothetical protein